MSATAAIILGLVCLWAGAAIGFVLAAMFIVARRADEDAERARRRPDA